MTVVEITSEAQFAEAKSEGGLLVVNFTAKRSTARHMVPAFLQLSEETAGRATFASVDVDAQIAIATAEGIDKMYELPRTQVARAVTTAAYTVAAL